MFCTDFAAKSGVRVVANAMNTMSGKWNIQNAAAFENDLQVGADDAKELLRSLSTQTSLVSRILRRRAAKHFIDMKRGELYPEIIAYATELRSLISKV